MFIQRSRLIGCLLIWIEISTNSLYQSFDIYFFFSFSWFFFCISMKKTKFNLQWNHWTKVHFFFEKKNGVHHCYTFEFIRGDSVACFSITDCWLISSFKFNMLLVRGSVRFLVNENKHRKPFFFFYVEVFFSLLILRTRS